MHAAAFATDIQSKTRNEELLSLTNVCRSSAPQSDFRRLGCDIDSQLLRFQTWLTRVPGVGSLP